MIEQLTKDVFDHKMPIVFVGGPYSQPDPCININATAKLLDRLWFDGIVFPICPMIESHMQHLLIPRPYEHWLLRCMRFIRFVDAGIFRPGVSSGKAREQGLFKARNIPFFEESDENRAVTALYLWVDEIWKPAHANDAGQIEKMNAGELLAACDQAPIAVLFELRSYLHDHHANCRLEREELELWIGGRKSAGEPLGSEKLIEWIKKG